MMETVLEINKTYSKNEIKSVGLVPKKTEKLKSKVFTKNNKVYFFENLNDNTFRLFSIINKRSFFL